MYLSGNNILIKKWASWQKHLQLYDGVCGALKQWNNDKTIIRFDFCDIQNNQGQGECRYHKNFVLWFVLCKNCTGQDLPPTVVGLNRTESEKQIEINPLSSNIHIQILQTDLYTFPLRIS